MALIKTTAIVDEISGKIQGSVFAHNKGGSYVRGRGLMTNTASQYQIAARTIFTSISQRWRALTQEQRKSWVDAAVNFPYINRLGDKKELTGKALFQQLNNNLVKMQQSQLDSPPAPGINLGFELQDLEPTVTVDATGALTAFDFDLKLETPPGVETPSDYIVEATTGLSMGRNQAKNQYRVIGLVDGTSLTTPDHVTEADVNYNGESGALNCYKKRLGDPAKGMKVFLKVTPVNRETGQSGLGIIGSNEVF